MNIRQLNDAIAITDLLAREGILPTQKKGSDWWYISPIRPQERTASFKVDTKINRWYDHGTGEGGKLFDLALRLYPSLNNSQVIQKLENYFSFQQPISTGIQPQPVLETTNSQLSFAAEKKKIQVISEHPITAPALIHYLEQRRIPLDLARAYCREVQYELYGKQYYAIGFKSDAGGYELRNPYFKGSSSPKGSRFINNGEDRLYVFEGYFNFLSFLTLQTYRRQHPGNYLILNSLSFFEKCRSIMEQHTEVSLYLDRDKSGTKYTAQALKDNSRFKDGSKLYQDHSDLNQWLVQNFSLLQQKARALHQANELAQAIQNKRATHKRKGKKL